MERKLNYKKPTYLPVLRELVRTVQTFEKFSSRNIHTFGYTMPQFDVLVTLGNTEGMTFKELGEKTLITKGTLTGIIDRLEMKGLVRRNFNHTDARKTIVELTPIGENEFVRIFPAHLEYNSQAFDQLCHETLERLGNDAKTLRLAFEKIALQQG